MMDDAIKKKAEGIVNRVMNEEWSAIYSFIQPRIEAVQRKILGYNVVVASVEDYFDGARRTDGEFRIKLIERFVKKIEDNLINAATKTEVKNE
jgi:hypothetical protein